MYKKVKFILIAIYHKTISTEKLAKKLGVKFGENCHFMTKSWGSEPYLIRLGNSVKTSSGVKFITHDGSSYVIREKYKQYKNIDIFGEIIIGNNVFIGMDTIILPNTIIEDNVIIGAKSLVKGRLKSDSVYAGTPIKHICSLDEFVNKHHQSFDNTGDFSPKDKKNYLLKKFNITKAN